MRELFPGRQLRIFLLPANWLGYKEFFRLQRQHGDRHAGTCAAIRTVRVQGCVLAIRYTGPGSIMCRIGHCWTSMAVPGMQGSGIAVVTCNGMRSGWQRKTQRQDRCTRNGQPDEPENICQKRHAGISPDGTGPRQDGNHALGAQICVIQTCFSSDFRLGRRPLDGSSNSPAQEG
ncbi:hypothetical protein N6L27_17510 [Leisingera sp. SS27]|uniref:hypothetical protein n=1 Tax=Leisingera sp. SS27 TaxID=2979462 RepID=UPI00232CE2D5|nr:hypothetical protein [Leisingera sp. SS27]MDC0659800.1 hypothetical protein [Leisingera sp. SS27]